MSQPDLLEIAAPAAPAAPVVLNTAHARQMLQKRYPAPEWSLMQEVAPATGGGTRYADAVAVNLWQSRGHAVHGFEIKVSRSDWLRELKQPEKAEEIYRYCDHWWILAPKGVVKDGELPPTWGLLELRESGIVQSVAAKKLTPVPVTREFFASLMRRGHEQITAIAARMQHAAVTQAYNEIQKRVEEDVKNRTRDHKELQERVARFSAETGISFDRYSGPSISTIKLAQRLETLNGWRGAGALDRLAELAAELERAAGTVRTALAETGLTEVEK